MMAEARARGAFTTGDVYPYTAGQGPLAAIMMPAWATEGGEAAMAARFKDPELRRRIVADIEQAMTMRFGGVGGVYVASLKRELADIAAEMGVSPGEAIVRLLERGKPLYAFLRFGSDADVVAMLRDPFVAVACDCGSTKEMAGHPRTFGTFPRVLGRHVRDRGDLTWEEAIRKMTGLPAAIIGLTDRGFIATGMAADIVVFDPRAIIDRATYEEPRLSEGVREVLVNGRLAVRQGRPTGLQGGQVLRRARNMPTREAPRAQARSFAASLSTSGPAGRRVRAALTQARGARSATGVLEVRDARGRTTFAADAFGLIQTTKGWASATGVGRLASGERRSFLITVDRADPADGRGSLSLLIDGEAPIVGAPSAG
jgi:hypothetical protein